MSAPRSLWRVSASLGLRSLPVPALGYIPLGYLLGPHGINVLSPAVLDHLHIAIWLALATLGVFVGLAIDLASAGTRWLLAAASAQAIVTGAIVAAVAGWFAWHWRIALPNPVAWAPVALGICAAASAALVRHEPGGDDSQMVQIADLDDVVVIVAAGVLLVSHRAAPLESAAQAGGITILLGVLIGLVGWLLFERARSEAERGVFVLGAVALAGGTAAYLGLSPLLLGMVTGMTWFWTPGRANHVVESALHTIQHPLLVLLLVMAGALLTLTPASLWLLAIVVISRLAGKLVGSWTAARMLGRLAPAQLGARLMPCGVLGVATALHYNALAGEQAGGVVLSVTALATMLFEIVAVAALADRAQPA